MIGALLILPVFALVVVQRLVLLVGRRRDHRFAGARGVRVAHGDGRVPAQRTPDLGRRARIRHRRRRVRDSCRAGTATGRPSAATAGVVTAMTAVAGLEGEPGWAPRRRALPQLDGAALDRRCPPAPVGASLMPADPRGQGVDAMVSSTPWCGRLSERATSGPRGIGCNAVPRGTSVADCSRIERPAGRNRCGRTECRRTLDCAHWRPCRTARLWPLDLGALSAADPRTCGIPALMPQGVTLTWPEALGWPLTYRETILAEEPIERGTAPCSWR